MAESSNGNAGCPCINVTQKLLSVSARHCELENGNIGTKLRHGGACVSPTYGSSICLQHEMIHDPACSLDDVDKAVVPPYCFRPWCYVDHESCKKNSYERVYRSSIFGYDSGVDIYFSYSTCNSTAEDWLVAQDTDLVPRTLGGVDIVCNVPMVLFPSEFDVPFTIYFIIVCFESNNASDIY